MDQINLLLVDDEPANLQVLFSALSEVGAVRFATTGEKALELARQNPPDVVLLDYFMPGMSGLEVCLAMKADPVLARAHIIFVSGSSEATEVDAALDAGAFDFTTKPVNPRLIRHKVALAHRMLGPEIASAPTTPTRPALQTILLVEDGAINRAVIAEILETESHRVTMAETGAEAIALFEQQAFDCVLLDIHLPDMTGLKVIRHLRSGQQADPPVRIIAVTGDVTTESLEDYTEAGFDGVAPKPVDPATLLSLVAGQSVTLTDALMSAPDLAEPDLLIDPQRIKVLKETYSETRLQGLFALFEKEINAYIALLQQAWDSGDLDSVTRTAHRLKSALGHFACARMQKIASILNQEQGLPAPEKGRLITLLADQRAATLQALAGALDIQTQ
ncbi:MAG: response regulator [Rhodospirillaceae bacterium]